MLCAIENGDLGISVWDPRKNIRDRSHVMPIITPGYPCMNSSYNVSTNTLRVIMEQFKLGNKICQVHTIHTFTCQIYCSGQSSLLIFDAGN